MPTERNWASGGKFICPLLNRRKGLEWREWVVLLAFLGNSKHYWNSR
jgi:hypothetical protein